MKLNRRYWMMDLEFTSLDPFKAYITEYGLVEFNPRTFKPLQIVTDKCPVMESMWDSDTLAWAKGTYSDKELEDYVYSPQSKLRLRHYPSMRRKFIEGLCNALKSAAGSNPTECILIVNHPECDVTITKMEFRRAHLTWPMHYQSVKDMDSLMMGASVDFVSGEGFQSTYDGNWELVKAKGKGRETVKHTAVADCLSQIDLLKEFGVWLP